MQQELLKIFNNFFTFAFKDFLQISFLLSGNIETDVKQLEIGQKSANVLLRYFYPLILISTYY